MFEPSPAPCGGALRRSPRSSLSRRGLGFILPLFLLVSGIRCVQDFFTGPAPPAAVRLAFKVQPGPTAAGSRFSPAIPISVLDSLGNTVNSASTSVTVAITGGTGTRTMGTTPASGTLYGTPTATAVAGVATLGNLHIAKAGGGYTLAAMTTGLTGATSNTFAISPGPPAQLAFIVQPSTAQAGVAITPAVHLAVEDSVGNTVPTATNSITVGFGTNPTAATAPAPATTTRATGTPEHTGST